MIIYIIIVKQVYESFFFFKGFFISFLSSLQVDKVGGVLGHTGGSLLHFYVENVIFS